MTDRKGNSYKFVARYDPSKKTVLAPIVGNEGNSCYRCKLKRLMSIHSDLTPETHVTIDGKDYTRVLQTSRKVGNVNDYTMYLEEVRGFPVDLGIGRGEITITICLNCGQVQPYIKEWPVSPDVIASLSSNF